jgi:hypothetical protein
MVETRLQVAQPHELSAFVSLALDLRERAEKTEQKALDHWRAARSRQPRQRRVIARISCRHFDAPIYINGRAEIPNFGYSFATRFSDHRWANSIERCRGAHFRLGLTTTLVEREVARLSQHAGHIIASEVEREGRGQVFRISKASRGAQSRELASNRVVELSQLPRQSQL